MANGKRQGCLTPDLMHPFLGMYDGLDGQGDIASLLTTDTGDAGTSVGRGDSSQ